MLNDNRVQDQRSVEIEVLRSFPSKIQRPRRACRVLLCTAGNCLSASQSVAVLPWHATITPNAALSASSPNWS